MAKHWTMADDDMLVRFFDAAGATCLAVDLDRPEAAVRARTRLLKKNGAWAALEQMHAGEAAYLAAFGGEEGYL